MSLYRWYHHWQTRLVTTINGKCNGVFEKACEWQHRGDEWKLRGGRRKWATNTVAGKLSVDIRNDSLRVSESRSQIQALLANRIGPQKIQYHNHDQLCARSRPRRSDQGMLSRQAFFHGTIRRPTSIPLRQPTLVGIARLSVWLLVIS